MPKRITKGENYSEFNYGPEHQRTRQFRKDLRIVYAEGQELEINGSNMTIKTYWPTGLGVEIVRPNGSVEDNWFHTDRLGSVIAISDKSGAIKESLAYDAWGKRRTLNGSATPDNLDGLIDNKGYTGHEMLDQLDLVHMNGRVFDPFTARFMSADPHVTNPNDGQNFNRYSYVWNNPLVNTDPTGLDGRGIGWEVYWSAPTYSAGGGADGGAPAEGKQLPNIAMLIREVTSPNSKGSEKSSGTDDRPKPSCDLPLCVEMIGHNPDKPQNTGWRAAIGMTADWTSGHGASYRIYDGSTSSSQNMMQARRVNEARQYFYQKNAEALAAGKPLAPVTNYKGDFGVFDLVWYAGLNPTQQFVGSYRIDISPVGNDQIRFELNNNSSMKSFLYGIGPAWERSSSDTNFGNMRQTYTWTEPIKR
jgi:RHS repeat-associated protein